MEKKSMHLFDFLKLVVTSDLLSWIFTFRVKVTVIVMISATVVSSVFQKGDCLFPVLTILPDLASKDQF